MRKYRENIINIGFMKQEQTSIGGSAAPVHPVTPVFHPRSPCACCVCASSPGTSTAPHVSGRNRRSSAGHLMGESTPRKHYGAHPKGLTWD